MTPRRRIPWRRLLLLVALALYWWRPPDLPRLFPGAFRAVAPLDARAPPDRLTRTKLDRLQRDPLACLDALTRARGAWRPLPDRDFGAGCAQRNAVSVRRLGARVEPFVLSCRAALSLALWETHVVQPAAQRHFASGVARIEHFGSYACRNVYGRADGARSRHATADAVDIAGFVLEDGRRVRVAADWNRGDAAARFLRDVHAGGCRWFDGALGPDYNAAHADHFHFDRGGWRACR